MSEEIKPVLTAEEWAEVREWDELPYGKIGLWGHARPAASAAIILSRADPDGGPLLTWEDVDALRDAAYMIEGDLWRGDVDSDDQVQRGEGRALLAVAYRIASLLPPREP